MNCRFHFEPTACRIADQFSAAMRVSGLNRQSPQNCTKRTLGSEAALCRFNSNSTGLSAAILLALLLCGYSLTGFMKSSGAVTRPMLKRWAPAADALLPQ